MHAKVKFVEGFKDGTIFPRAYGPGEEAVLTEAQLAQVRRSGGVVEIVEQVIPNPRKADKNAVYEVPRRDMNDPQNAENSINRLDDHVPGTEEEVAEFRRLQELERQANPSVEKVGVESVFNDEPARIDAEARLKVEKAQQEREAAHEKEREESAQAEKEVAEAKLEKEREEYQEAAVEADRHAEEEDEKPSQRHSSRSKTDSKKKK